MNDLINMYPVKSFVLYTYLFLWDAEKVSLDIELLENFEKHSSLI